MSAIVQGIQHAYDVASHAGPWTVFPDGNVSGNPTRRNIKLDNLRKALKKDLARNGRVRKRASPLTVEHVCQIFLNCLDQTDDEISTGKSIDLRV